MSDVVTSTSGSSPVQAETKKENPHIYWQNANAKAFLEANKDGTAVYLGGEEKDGKVYIKPNVIKNAVNGKSNKGTNQFILQNALKKAGIKDTEVISSEQLKNAGTEPKKNSPYVVVTIPTEIKDGKYKQDIFRYFPKSAAVNPGAVLVARNNAQRYKTFNYLHHKLEEEKDQDKRQALMTALAYEHKNNIDYIIASSKPEELEAKIQDYKNKNFNAIKNEKGEVIVSQEQAAAEGKLVEALYAKQAEKGYASPELKALYGSAVNKEKEKMLEAAKKVKKETPVINAENETVPETYLGKYLAAAELGATFVTTKETQNNIQEQLNKRLSQSFSQNRYTDAFAIGKLASERCKEEMATFSKLSREEQRGITNTRPIQQERSEQDIEMTVF